MSRVLVLAAIVVLAAGAPEALARPHHRKPRPPSKAEAAALKVAASWIAAMHFGEATRPVARGLTARRMWSIAADDHGAVCPESDSAATGLACLHQKITPAGKPRLWRRTLDGPLAAHVHRIDAVARGGIVVELDEGCGGSTENQMLLVIKNKQVTAALAQTITCAE